jgi:hypothetical protein
MLNIPIARDHNPVARFFSKSDQFSVRDLRPAFFFYSPHPTSDHVSPQ